MCEAVSLRIFESEMTVSRSDAAVNFAGGAATRGAAGAVGAVATQPQPQFRQADARDYSGH